MTNFKHKVDKTIKLNHTYDMSIDKKHQSMMKEIEHNDSDIIPKYEKYINEMKDNIRIIKNEIRNNEESEEYIDLLDEYYNCKDEIKKYEKKIRQLKEKKRKYLLEHSKTLFEYFKDKQTMKPENKNVDTIMNFFNLNHKNNNSKNQSKNENPLVRKYFSKLDDKFIDLNDYIKKDDKCELCNNDTLTIHNDGLKICNICGKQYKQLSEQEKPSYKEPPKEICSYAYKRKNHFKEILSQFQGKETTEIPKEVMSEVKNQIKKERISINELTNTKMKNILKKLGYNNYYEHITFIKSQLGIKPPTMSEELEEKLCNMFDEIQAPYAKYCPQERVNFLNYYGVLYKMCELLGEDEYLPYFHTLKDRVKRMEQDEIWKKICEELNWEFIPSV